MGHTRTSLAGKVAVITGGASGIGRALGEELASRGAAVVLADRQRALADEVAQGIAARGGRARGASLDVRILEEWEALLKGVLGAEGRVDYLFNNAGIGVGGEIETYIPADWDDVIDVNLRGVAYGVQIFYPVFIRQGSGHIVNTASLAGLVAAPTEGSYTATKHAVVGLTKALRVEAKRHGVRASVLCPGIIRTPILTGGVFGRLNYDNLSPEFIMGLWERGKPMDPADFARRSLDAVERNEAIIVEPRYWRALWAIERLSPTLSMFLWEKFLARFRSDLQAAGATAKKR